MQLESGSNALTLLEVDPSHLAGRTSLHPWEHNTAHQGGHFGVAFVSGDTTGIGAGGILASMQWANPDRLFFLQRLKVTAILLTAYAAIQENAIELVKVGSFTANDTGGTDLRPSIGSFNRKSARNMSPSSVADLRVCGAAALGAGAGSVAESLAVRAGSFNLGNTAFAVDEKVLFDLQPGQEHPLELQRFEGFRVRNIIAQGATGVVRFRFELDWLERSTQEAAG